MHLAGFSEYGTPSAALAAPNPEICPHLPARDPASGHLAWLPVDDFNETDIDETDLLIWALAEIFCLYGVTVGQGLKVIEERLPVAIAELRESETLH